MNLNKTKQYDAIMLAKVCQESCFNIWMFNINVHLPSVYEKQIWRKFYKGCKKRIH